MHHFCTLGWFNPSPHDVDLYIFTNDNILDWSKHLSEDDSLNVGQMTSSHLTHYQTTNFRLFQTERICRRLFQI